jgi:hypothetical protein
MGNIMEKEGMNGVQAMFMKETMRRAKKMGLEFILTQRDFDIKEVGLRVNGMGLHLLQILMDKKFKQSFQTVFK